MTAERKPDISASGALCWRMKKGRLEVLIIHRPRYDDWSWPKGKADPGETITETAIRELDEEVGARPILSIPLSSVRYTTKDGPKIVHYWAARLHGRPQPDGEEVDELRWVSVPKAITLLTSPSDRELAKELQQHHKKGRLDTWPLIILRHAKTVARASWDGPEADRPLTAKGRAQTVSLSRLLQAWQPNRLMTSPWLRCQATLGPYLPYADTPLEVTETLSEASHRSNRAKTAAVLNSVLRDDKPTLMCVHRPTLPTLLGALAEHCSEKLARRLPQSNPYLATAEMLVAHVRGGTVVALEQHRAPHRS